MSDPWVLCVDDEPKVLDGLELHLGFDHDVRLAESGAQGLALLQKDPDCGLIISDMRMPNMNGAEFLAAARKVAPDATRVLLTGYSEMSAAISAVNDGGIFRYLTKPTSPDLLQSTVAEGLRQNELIRSEKVLLEQTLHGAVETLVEALEIATPTAFSRCRRIEAGCRAVAETLRLDPVWPVALAGLLVRLGWIAIPSETIERHLAGRPLDETERSMIEQSYATGADLVQRIPRLQEVAGTIRKAAKPTGWIDGPTVVRAVADYDRLKVLRGGTAKPLRELVEVYPSEILAAIGGWEGEQTETQVREVPAAGLMPGMITEFNVETQSGSLLIAAGTELTETLVGRLRNFARSSGIKEPVVVSIPVPPETS